MSWTGKLFKFLLSVSSNDVVFPDRNCRDHWLIRNEIACAGKNPQHFIPAVFSANGQFNGFLFGVGKCRILGVSSAVLDADCVELKRVIAHELNHYQKKHILRSVWAKLIFIFAYRLERFSLTLLAKYEREADER